MSASENVRDDGADSSDAFPTTHVTWIHARIEEGELGREALNTHVMSRYARPLATYARASALRAIDEPDALVNGFFATRLVRAEYLASWRVSGLPLRRWLVNGLLLHGRERQREQRKAARDGAAAASPCGSCGCAGACAGGLGNGAAEVGLEPSAFEEFERAWSRALLSDACELAERELVAEGDADAWASFRRHNLDGLEYAEIAQQLRITPAEARTRARRAAYRFERALRRLLSDEGVAECDLEEEIAWLMEVSAR